MMTDFRDFSIPQTCNWLTRDSHGREPRLSSLFFNCVRKKKQKHTNRTKETRIEVCPHAAADDGRAKDSGKVSQMAINHTPFVISSSETA